MLVPDLDRRAKNSGAERWDGPWEVLETSKNEANNYTPTDYLIKRTGSTDYLIKRTGSRQQPKWQHIDNLKQTFEPQSEAHLLEPVAEEAVMKEAPASAPSYEVEEIVGEKGKSRKTKNFLVKYTGYEDLCLVAASKESLLHSEGAGMGCSGRSNKSREDRTCSSGEPRGRQPDHVSQP